MAAVNFRNATTLQGNATGGVNQALTLPTVVAGDIIVLLLAFVLAGDTVTLSGAGNWIFSPNSSSIAAQMGINVIFAQSLDGSESGATTNINFSPTTVKYAAIAASYSGLQWDALFGTGPLFAQNTTSNTTSATPPSQTPVPNSWGLSFYTAKSTTNASYTTPAGLTSRAQVFGTGGGAIDLALFDSNGPTSAVGGSTSTMGTATANKIAGSLVLNDKLVVPRMYGQAVKRAAYF